MLQCFDRLIAHGRHGSIFLSTSTSTSTSGLKLNESRVRVIKVVEAGPNGSSSHTRPHNILTEVNILKSLHHPNIISLIAYEYNSISRSHKLELPYLPFTLSQISNLPVNGTLIKSITFQLISAIHYIHSNDIAHRDLNPRNILLDWDGTVKLIDFGISWSCAGNNASYEDIGQNGGDEDGWVEKWDDMICEVGTGQYRAPELLFSPTRYDPKAIDLWALGTILAEFFTPRRSSNEETTSDDFSSNSDIDSEASDDKLSVIGGSEVEPDQRQDQDESHLNTFVSKAPRRPLFSSTFGDIGLAASIFRVLGTPDSQSWPEYKNFPDANKIQFDKFTPQSLIFTLPDVIHLDQLLPLYDKRSTDLNPDNDCKVLGNQAKWMLEILESLLVLSPSRRVPAFKLLRYPYSNDNILVPAKCKSELKLIMDGDSENRLNGDDHILVDDIEGLKLVDYIKDLLDHAERKLDDMINGRSLDTI